MHTSVFGVSIWCVWFRGVHVINKSPHVRSVKRERDRERERKKKREQRQQKEKVKAKQDTERQMLTYVSECERETDPTLTTHKKAIANFILTLFSYKTSIADFVSALI